MIEILKNLTARDVMKKDVLSIDETETVLDAVKLMDRHNVGAVVVMSAIKDAMGIFTERDLLRRVVAVGKVPQATRITEVMTPEFECAQASDDAYELLSIMVIQRFRHLPVMDGRKLVGIVSTRDLYTKLVKLS
ncbi:MAG: histidine kinase [Deltaproteobacteria bacterium CG11_big_fil_rev_8_21_14_0_20_47_16]|nr:MAG: histidine kinase [Deltaproteobacteria bacterium CG11_big_fil_rev_8_21_14_0_20_47_16]